jgi:nucleotide-binding universal stress UspA family protein
VLISRSEVHMIALQHILVATDFSEPSEAALDYGRDLAHAYGATLHVVHVIEDMLAFYGPDVGFALAGVEQNVEAAVLRDLDATIARIDGGSVNVRAMVTRGTNVAHTITEYAVNNAVDLIVVGTHGRGAVSRFLMGSVAERVVRSAPCPVLTVRAFDRAAAAPHDDRHVRRATRGAIESDSLESRI